MVCENFINISHLSGELGVLIYIKNKQMKNIGIVIMILGLILTIFTAITFFTKEKVVDLGILEVTRDQPHSLNWSPFIGIAVMVVGGFMILQARKK